MALNSCTTVSGLKSGQSFREVVLRHIGMPMHAVAMQPPAIELLLEGMHDVSAMAKPCPVGR